MARFLLSAGFLVAIGLLIYFGRYVPTPEEIEFEKKFNLDAVLVKTCGNDPATASGGPLKVYRFENELWFKDIHRWRRIEGKADNVCDLLDIDAAHRPGPPQFPALPGPASRLLDFFRKPEQTQTPPKEIPPAKPNE